MIFRISSFVLKLAIKKKCPVSWSESQHSVILPKQEAMSCVLSFHFYVLSPVFVDYLRTQNVSWLNTSYWAYFWLTCSLVLALDHRRLKGLTNVFFYGFANSTRFWKSTVLKESFKLPRMTEETRRDTHLRRLFPFIFSWPVCMTFCWKWKGKFHVDHS